MLIAIVWSANTFAQTIKTYNGGMDLPKDAFFDSGTPGYGSYQYYEKNGKRVKHGSFRFTDADEKETITGQFVHGRKQGTWSCQSAHSYTQDAHIEVYEILNNVYVDQIDKRVYTESSKCTINFKDDMPDGSYQYTYKSTDNGKTTKSYSSSGTMKNGRLSETSTTYYRDFSGERYRHTSKCMFDSRGRANGIWTVNHISGGKNSVFKFEFCHGMYIRTSQYDNSTGENKVLYSDIRYDTYKYLSKIECDTLVKGVGPCLNSGYMLYKHDPKLKDNGHDMLDIIAGISACIPYEIERGNDIFCSWSAYKTIAEIVAAEQRKLELERKIEEQKRFLEKQREEKARLIAEAQERIEAAKRQIAANAPLLKQVADNDRKIDSIYRKKNKPFFYNMSSEYVKPIIRSKYKGFCLKMDSCDVTSINDVLYLQDVVMKLRYLKTKTVEQRLKKGRYYTEESVKGFSRDEALNLAK